MSYNALNIHLSGPESEKKKAEIFAEADKRGLSVSKFILSCYEIVIAARKQKDKTNGGSK